MKKKYIYLAATNKSEFWSLENFYVFFKRVLYPLLVTCINSTFLNLIFIKETCLNRQTVGHQPPP